MKPIVTASLLASSIAIGMAGAYALDPREVVQVGKDPTTTALGEGEAPRELNPGAVKVELFVMSQCPYGVQVVDAVKPVVDDLGGDVDLHLEFIGNHEGGNLSSMHGPSEVAGDMAQLCAAKHAPSRYLEMVACQNKDMRSVATSWERCSRQAELPVERIRTCMQGSEGRELVAASFDRAAARGATGSPTIFIAGKPYEGGRETRDFLRAICAEHPSAASGSGVPEACASLPPVAPVNVTVLNDKRCADCDPGRMMQSLQSRILQPVIKTVDYGSEEGKALYAAVGGGTLPVIVFDDTLDDDVEARDALTPSLKRKGEHRVLSTGSSHNPLCADPGGCDKEECKETFGCRKEAPATLEVFVMSQCPYGVKALDAMEEVLEAFGDELTFRVHYIAEGTAKDGFTALHGQPEVDENIRELCAIKHYPTQFMDYILCRNDNIRSDAWEGCAKGAIKADVIRTCFEGDEGAKLHEEDIKLAGSLGIGASPTWLVNNRHKFSGIDAATIGRNVCEHNPKLKGCQKTLSGNAAAAPAGAGQEGCGTP